MSQITLPPEEEFRQRMLEKLPPMITREAVDFHLGGLVKRKTLSNADSAGTGPLGAYVVGRKVTYPAPSLVDWVIKKFGVEYLNANLKEL